MSLVASRFLMFTHLCVWCCHIYVPQTACPPNEPYAAALIAHLTPCYSIFPKKLRFCKQVISPAEINRLLTADLVCCLFASFPRPLAGLWVNLLSLFELFQQSGRIHGAQNCHPCRLLHQHCYIEFGWNYRFVPLGLTGDTAVGWNIQLGHYITTPLCTTHLHRT